MSGLSPIKSCSDGNRGVEGNYGQKESSEYEIEKNATNISNDLDMLLTSITTASPIRQIYMDGDILQFSGKPTKGEETSGSDALVNTPDISSSEPVVNPYSFSLSSGGNDTENRRLGSSSKQVTSARSTISPPLTDLPATGGAVTSFWNFIYNGEKPAASADLAPSAMSPNVSHSPAISYPMTFSDVTSPFPETSFSPRNRLQAQVGFKMFKILEEVFESEESYLISMKILQNNYVEPFMINSKSDIPTPIKLLKLYLNMLVETHTFVLDTFRSLFENPIDLDRTAISISNVINSHCLYKHVYSEYCNIFENVLRILEDNKKPVSGGNAWNRKWIKGWEIYLEATQPRAKHMDLSFFSLIQRPIARIGKYRLLIDSIYKTISENNKAVVSNIASEVKDKLEYINNCSKEFNANELNQKLNELVDYGGIDANTSISSQFFGTPFLIGAVAAIWVEDGESIGKTLGSVLYKSHLLLVDMTKGNKSKKNPVKFLVPLSKCKIICNYTEMEGGLISFSLRVIKLIFEIKLKQYEILLHFVSNAELKVWSDYLEMLVNFVNGPYKLDYSGANYDVLSVFPPGLNPYEINLLNTANYAKYKNSCYFRDAIPIHIHAEFATEDETQGNIPLASFHNSPFRIRDTDTQIFLKKSERSATESKLREVWSKELSSIFSERGLRKSASWSALKRTSMRSSTITSSPHHSNGTSEGTITGENCIREKFVTSPVERSFSMATIKTGGKSLLQDLFRSTPWAGPR
ncbi:uncharacterized protein RJT20DRAFT_58529 [Scheffersomyces xylosifermentans]|uniref:uncharacterized protein n=1 Tax=Scheffersomyces xylosifermentans TaxID=1304137 RepID=UPI00315DBE68